MGPTTITINTVSELAAAVDHLLGFTPTESIVAVNLAVGMHTRVDFPTTIEDMTLAGETLGRAYRQAPGEVHLFAYIEDPTHIVAARTVLNTVAAGFQGGNLIAATYQVTADQWYDLTPGHDREHGTITQADRDRVAVQAIAAGRRLPAADRATHVNRFARVGAAEQIRVDVMDTVLAELHSETREETATGSEAITCTARATGLPLSESEAARMLVLSAVAAFRATTIMSSGPDDGRADLAMWTQVATHAPDYLDRTGALHLAAFSAWRAGDGALAMAALDTAHDEGAATDDVAALIITLATTGVNPHTWNPDQLRP